MVGILELVAVRLEDYRPAVCITVIIVRNSREGVAACDDQAVNLGVVLTIWDILTGYARFPALGDSLTRTGLDGRPVPVEQDDSDRRAPVLVARQLIEPFQAQR